MIKNKALVEFKLDSGGVIVFETTSEASQGITRVSKSSDGISQANDQFETVIKRIKPAAQLVLDTFKELNTPSEIALEFGISFSAKAGVIIASADSSANFKVNLKWKNSDTEKGTTTETAVTVDNSKHKE